MNNRKIFVICLSILLLVVSGCAGPVERMENSDVSSTRNASSLIGSKSSESCTLKTFCDISMVNENVGYAATRECHLLKTDNGWANYSDLLTLKNCSVNSRHPVVFALNENTVYVAFFTNLGIEVEKSINSGINWSTSIIKMQTDCFDSGYGGSIALSFINTSEGFLLTSSLPATGLMSKALYRTLKQGSVWNLVCKSENNQTESKNMVGIDGYTTGMSFFGSGTGFITCSYHGQKEISIYKKIHNGESWSTTALPIPDEYAPLIYNQNYYADVYPPAIYGANRKNAKMQVYFYHDKNCIPYIYSTQNDGDSWKIEGKSNLLMKRYCFTDGQNGYGLNKDGELYHTNNGGLIWTKAKKYSMMTNQHGLL